MKRQKCAFTLVELPFGRLRTAQPGRGSSLTLVKLPVVSTRKSPGFTLVELLVVIAIIGVLVALLLPAVQAVRAAARRSQCQNNLKQLGLAVLNYHDQQGRFPNSLEHLPGDPAIYIGLKPRRNWIITILPFMEQQPIYDRFDFSVPIGDDVNREPRGTQIASLLCPSDDSTLQSQPFAGVHPLEGDNWARGNYAGNAAMGAMIDGVDTDPRNRSAAGPRTPRWLSPWSRGIMGVNTEYSLAQVVDGASNTLMISEVRVGLAPVDRRGTWALAGAAASSLWMHGDHDANGPNPCSIASDNILGCTALMKEIGEETVNQECMGCWYGATTQGAARSRHVGGVFATFADGSVHFLSDYIQKSEVGDLEPVWVSEDPEQRMGVWQRLNASADSLIVDGSSY